MKCGRFVNSDEDDSIGYTILDIDTESWSVLGFAHLNNLNRFFRRWIHFRLWLDALHVRRVDTTDGLSTLEAISTGGKEGNLAQLQIKIEIKFDSQLPQDERDTYFHSNFIRCAQMNQRFDGCDITMDLFRKTELFSQFVRNRKYVQQLRTCGRKNWKIGNRSFHSVESWIVRTLRTCCRRYQLLNERTIARSQQRPPPGWTLNSPSDPIVR